ncbi:unnamed protein product [Parnassius mnemosyne]|uniref:Helitron helicase-like domain-containing protein n=1 Tax=Parnassius mnemosyne TaxID=213953 RepID=A0AAV1M809_9NEOP
MIQLFGVPTLLIVISAAETQWLHLIEQIKNTVDQKEMSLEESQNIPYAEKVRLIQSDPFTCATFFETSLVGPFGEREISHQYHRIEFQSRGSPHAHMMLWIEDAPIFIRGDQSSTEKVTMFVDQIISSNIEELNEDLVKIQTHKHTHSCHRKLSRPCRFGIPFFSMDKTRILTSLKEDNPRLKEWKEISKKWT